MMQISGHNFQPLNHEKINNLHKGVITLNYRYVTMFYKKILPYSYFLRRTVQKAKMKTQNRSMLLKKIFIELWYRHSIMQQKKESI